MQVTQMQCCKCKSTSVLGGCLVDIESSNVMFGAHFCLLHACLLVQVPEAGSAAAISDQLQLLLSELRQAHSHYCR